MRAAVPGWKCLRATACMVLLAATAFWRLEPAYAQAVPKHLIPLTVDLLRGVKEGPETGGEPEEQPGPAEPSEPDPANAGWGSVGQEEAQPTDPDGGVEPRTTQTTATAPGGARSGSIISLDGDLYAADEPVEVRFRVPEEGFYQLEALPLRKSDEDWDNNRSGETERLEAGKSLLLMWPGRRLEHIVDPFFDFALKASGGAIHHIRLVRQDPLLPNAIKVVDGPRHPLGSKVFVEVDLPDRYLPRQTDGGHSYPNRLVLDIVLAARRVRGGTVTPDWSMASFRVTAGHNRIEITTRDDGYYRLIPGLFDLRLLRNGVVVDRTPLLITVDQLPGSLRLVDDEPLDAGKPISVVFDAPPVPHLSFSYGLQFFPLDDNGRPIVDFNRPRQSNDDVGPGEPIRLQHPRGRGGNHVVRLLLKHAYSGAWYVLDSLELELGRASRRDFHFTVAGRSQFESAGMMIAQGEKIPVELSLRGPFAMPGADVTFRLFRLPSDAGKGPSVVASGTSIGKLIEEWPPVDGGDEQAWLIDKDLEIGRYAVAMEFEPTKQDHLFYFEIVPGVARVKLSLGGRQRFQVAESFDVSLELPPGYSAADRKFELLLTAVGGHVPGCAVKVPIFGTYGAKKKWRFEGTSETIGPMGDVGVYLLQLYEKSNTKRKLLDEVAFEVVAEPLPGSITLPDGASYRPQGEMTISIAVPAGHPSTVAGKYRIADPSFSVLRHGAATTTGAILPANPMRVKGTPGDREFRKALVEGGGKAEFPVKTPPPGSYEVRLSSGGNLLAHAPFTVVHPKSPFALDYGLESVSLRNDIDAANNPWPAKGEYLSGADCEPEIFKEEEMDLRFVRWQDGRHVPIEGALNFGDAFYLEGRLEAPAAKNAYFAQIGPAEGDTEEVTLFPDEDDPKLVRSELLYFIWDSPEEEADGAAQ